MVTFFTEDPSKNEYKCIDGFSTWCRSAGDPHIKTYDGAKIDIYGQAQYLLTASNGTADGAPGIDLEFYSKNIIKIRLFKA